MKHLRKIFESTKEDQKDEIDVTYPIFIISHIVYINL
jgi:hypothetical protein